jgi:hypothetical protein
LLINLINETQVAKPKNQALTPNQGKPQKEILKVGRNRLHEKSLIAMLS